jgi:poly-gamma-glutamate capsule biosynthesis protein CapA/YwtB (metallophosphatase superfamily)
MTGDQSLQPAWAFPGDFNSGPGARLLLNWEITDDSRTHLARLIQKWSPGIAALANSQNLDVCREELATGVESLHQSGFKTLGAGMTPEEASRPLLWETAEGGITILNWVFAKGPANAEASGANLWPGLMNAGEIIRNVKRTSDWVLVVIHWNGESFPHPHPEQRDIARQLAGFGADAVIGQHPYGVRGMEFMESCPVFYGLGTFFSTMESSDIDAEGSDRTTRRRDSLGVRFNFQHGKPLEYELLSFWNNYRAAQRDHAERAFRRMNSMSLFLHDRKGEAYLDWYEKERIRMEKNQSFYLRPLKRGLSRSLRRWVLRSKII